MSQAIEFGGFLSWAGWPQLADWPWGIIAGAVFIAFYAWQHFNTWTEQEALKLDLDHSQPPRHFTTWGRFVLGTLHYTFWMEVFYLALVQLLSAQSLNFLNGFMGGGLSPAMVTQFSDNRVLGALLLITGIIPNFPVVARLEAYMRERLHYRAFIPDEVRACIHYLKTHPQAFRPERETLRVVLEGEGQGLLTEEDFRGGPLQACARLFYLNHQLQRWQGQREVVRALSHSRPACTALERELPGLRKDLQQYRLRRQWLAEQGGSEEPDDYLDRLEHDIQLKSETLLDWLYSIVCCTVHAVEVRPRRRRQAFRRFGLYPRPDGPLPLDVDTLVMSALAMFAALLIPTLLFHTVASLIAENGVTPRSPAESLRWTLSGLLMHLGAIGCALLTYRLVMHCRRHAGAGPWGFYPGRCLLGFVAGYAGGLTVLVLWMLWVGGRPVAGLLNSSLPYWALLPGLTGWSVVYHLDVSIHRSGGRRLQEGLLQGLFTGLLSVAIALLTNGWVFDNPRLFFMGYAGLTGFLIGFGIGFIFPHGYRHRLAALRRDWGQEGDISASTLLSGQRPVVSQPA